MWLVLLSTLTVATALDCYYCGVFLSAPRPECRGVPGNVSCSPENLGCLSIVGKNEDDTFYVEKRCAVKSDEAKEGCHEIGIRGMRATQCLCVGELCNHSHLPTLGFSVILAYVFFA